MNWNSADMASSNAAFWTGRDSKGDGSETMVLKSRAFCTFFFFFEIIHRFSCPKGAMPGLLFYRGRS